MKLSKIQTQAVTAYAGFIDAGITYGEAMRRVAAECGETPCLTLLAELAKVHAEKYSCNYEQGTSGGYVFFNGEESTRESRNHGADKSWKRNVMVWFEPTKQPTKPKSMRVSPAMREAAMAFLGEFEGKDLQAQINAAIAVLKAMK